MDRELVLAALAVLVVGAAVPVGALLAAPFECADDPRRPGRDLERRTTRRLLIPLLPSAFVVAILLGWVIVEPEASERVPWSACVVAAPVLLVWSRALGRAVHALVPRRVRTAATVGLVAPRVILDARFAGQVDEHALQAVLAHERAHVAHRDPLRIWLGQIVTDLQWPIPGARIRFMRWLMALELARDEEARGEVEGADLAAAIIAAARIERPTPYAHAGIAPADAALKLRVERLLGPAPAAAAAGSLRAPTLLFLLVIAASFFLGAGFGESLVRQVLGWGH